MPKHFVDKNIYGHNLSKAHTSCKKCKFLFFTFPSRQMCPSVYTKSIPNYVYMYAHHNVKYLGKKRDPKGILVFLTKMAERAHTLFSLLAGARLTIKTFPNPYVGTIFSIP